MNIEGGNSKLAHKFIDKDKFIQQAKAAKTAKEANKLKQVTDLKQTKDSVALSQQSKDLAQAAAIEKSTKTSSTLSENTKVETSSIETPKIESPDIKTPNIEAPEIKADDLRKVEKLDPKKSVERINAKKFGDLKKPAIFFVSGFDWWGAGSIIGDYDGIRDMAEAIEGARHYSWDQKDDMINEIMKRSPEQKIALIGHSLGGDTAMEIAQELNTLDKSFRSVDLLVTLDATGLDNDIVPTNVKRNINIFGENHLFYNDGPHVARDAARTVVSNELSPLDHTALDDSAEIQEQILHAINTAIG